MLNISQYRGKTTSSSVYNSHLLSVRRVHIIPVSHLSSTSSVFFFVCLITWSTCRCYKCPTIVPHPSYISLYFYPALPRSSYCESNSVPCRTVLSPSQSIPKDLVRLSLEYFFPYSADRRPLLFHLHSRVTIPSLVLNIVM